MERVTPLTEISHAVDTEHCDGSCLCGKVRNVMSAPFSVVDRRHHSSCHGARVTAHATNRFVSIDGMQFANCEDTINTLTVVG